MSKNNTSFDGIKERKRREPLTDTNLLLVMTICIFVVIYILAMIIWGGGFLTFQRFLDMFNTNSWLIIIACALTVVMISGGIDISVGGVVGLVTMACAVYLDSPGGSVMGSLGMALGIGLAFGIIQGFLIAYLEIQPFIVTLAGMFFARGMITIISRVPHTARHEAFVVLKDFRFDLPWEFLGTTGRAGNFIPARVELEAILAVLVVVVIFIIMRWTRLGRNFYAVGGNRQSSLMLGINVKRTKFYSFLISGFLAGLAGFAYLIGTGAGNIGNAVQGEMRAIASSIIGGTLLTGGVGNVAGTLFGVLTLLTIDSIVLASGLRDPWWQSITTGAMLTFFILLQSVILSRRGKGFKLPIPDWMKTRAPRE